MSERISGKKGGKGQETVLSAFLLQGEACLREERKGPTTGLPAIFLEVCFTVLSCSEYVCLREESISRT